MVFLIVMLVGSLMGCAEPRPQRALEEAQWALAQADSAEADMYAADLYEAARDSLVAGQAAMEAGTFDRARELLQAATALANQAASEAERQRVQLEIMPDSLGTPDSLSNGRG